MFKIHGGVNLPDNKKHSRYFKIEPIPAPKQLFIPLLQGTKNPAKPIVSVGDNVLQNQKIAEADGEFSANIHSPVSGTVEKIALHVHPNGLASSCIFIKNDFKENKIQSPPKEENIGFYELIAAIHEAGIDIGNEKIPDNIKIRNIIINGCESEDFLTAAHRQMLESPEKIIFGAYTVSQTVSAEKIYIAIENNKKDAIETLKQYTKQIPNIEIVSLPTKYPNDDEKQLVYALTGTMIPEKKQPSDFGYLVFDIDTVAAISDCIAEGLPFHHRIITVAGSGFSHAQNYKVPIGTPLSHIIETHGGFTKTPNRLILGGPMRGLAQMSMEVPIIKTTTAVLSLSGADVQKEKETYCIRCGRCVDGCPTKLRPINLANAAKNNDFLSLKNENISDCIHCGACSYICPAKIHLLQWIKTGEQLLETEN